MTRTYLFIIFVPVVVALSGVMGFPCTYYYRYYYYDIARSSCDARISFACYNDARENDVERVCLRRLHTTFV